MLADKNKVTELIPQKYPMVMVDGLISNNEDSTVSQLILSKSNIFCSDGFFNEPGIIENIAQTAALRSGYMAMVSGGKPKVGFIGSVKKLKIYHLPTDTDIIQTKVSILTSLMNVLIIKGEVFVNEELIAEGEMNIFLQSDK